MGIIFALGAIVTSMEGGPEWLVFTILGVGLVVGLIEMA